MNEVNGVILEHHRASSLLWFSGVIVTSFVNWIAIDSKNLLKNSEDMSVPG